MYLNKIHFSMKGGETMNSAKFIGMMHENGDTQTSLSKAMGIARCTLKRKIYEIDGAAFTLPELRFLKKRYSINDSEYMAIFFADDVS